MSEVEDPVAFLRSLGGLHDVSIEYLNMDLEHKSLELILDDLNLSFIDLVGSVSNSESKPAKLRFNDVGNVFIDIENNEGITISDATCTVINSKFSLVFDLRYGGRSKQGKSIIIGFSSLSIEY